MFLVGWLLSPIAGIVATIGLVMAWGALISVGLAVMGLARGRCKWYLIPAYIGLTVLFSLIYRGAFWLQSETPTYDPYTDDKVKTALFVTGMITAGLGALTQIKPFFKQVWDVTNSVAKDK